VKGPAAKAHCGTGARAVPAGGIASRSRAAPGINLPALPTGARGARWTEGQVKAGNARKNCVGSAPGMGIVTGSALIHVPRNMAWSRALGRRSLLGQSRGGTPIGVRALLSARPCQQHGRLDQASVGVPFPFFLSFVAWRSGVADSESKAPPLPFWIALPLRASSVAATAKLGRERSARTGVLFSSSPAKTGQEEAASPSRQHRINAANLDG
jgi:hypothetical protein